MTEKAVKTVDRVLLLDLFRRMCLIREFEERSGEMYARGFIRGFLHLYSGEEAIAVGAISVLRPEDYIVTHYRDHGHALARGLDTGRVMAELFGRATGVSGGKGGSMHLFDAGKNFMGGHAIVGGHLPLAAGLALAAQYKRDDRVAMAFLGDGSMNQGTFHETMNLAAVWRLPLVLILENNLYGMGSSVATVHAAAGDFSEAVTAYRVSSTVVDGMDVLAVREAAQHAVDRARAGDGPAFIEAKTFRFHGHSMADPGKYRPDAEEEYWRARDPLSTFPRMLVDNGLATQEELDAVRVATEAEVQQAVEFAEQSPAPEPAALHSDVYAPD